MRIALALLLVSVASTASASSKHWHENGGHSKKHAVRDDDRDARDCYFHSGDVRIIREYYQPRYRDLPPGLAKKLRRTGHLPPGWQKKMEPVPVVVERQLIALPPGYRRGYIDGAVVVYVPRTNVIVDIVAIFG